MSLSNFANATIKNTQTYVFGIDSYLETGLSLTYICYSPHIYIAVSIIQGPSITDFTIFISMMFAWNLHTRLIILLVWIFKMVWYKSHENQLQLSVVEKIFWTPLSVHR